MGPDELEQERDGWQSIIEGFPQNLGGIITESKSEKTSERRLWDLSLKFVEGRQWLSYDKNISQFVTSRMNAEISGCP